MKSHKKLMIALFLGCLCIVIVGIALFYYFNRYTPSHVESQVPVGAVQEEKNPVIETVPDKAALEKEQLPYHPAVVPPVDVPKEEKKQSFVDNAAPVGAGKKGKKGIVEKKKHAKKRLEQIASFKSQSVPVILESTSSKMPKEFQETSVKNIHATSCWVATFMRPKTQEVCTDQRNLIDIQAKNVNWNNVCVRVKNQVVPFEIFDRAKGKIILSSGISCDAVVTVRFCEKPHRCVEACRSKENDAFLASLGVDSEFTTDGRDAVSSTEGKLHNEIKKMNQLVKGMESTEPLFSNWKQESKKKGCQ